MKSGKVWAFIVGLVIGDTIAPLVLHILGVKPPPDHRSLRNVAEYLADDTATPPVKAETQQSAQQTWRIA